MSRNRWIELTEQNPDHSTWYVERFRSMAAGDGLAGEARFIDAMAPRGAGVHAVRADPLLTRLAIVQVLAFMSAGATSGLPTAGSSTGAEVVVDSLTVLRMIWW